MTDKEKFGIISEDFIKIELFIGRYIVKMRAAKCLNLVDFRDVYLYSKDRKMKGGHSYGRF